MSLALPQVSRWTVCVGLGLLGRVKPAPHSLFPQYLSPSPFLLTAAVVRLAASGRTPKCAQQLSPQTLVPAKKKPQILDWNSLCSFLRQTQRSHFFFKYSSPVGPVLLIRGKDRKLKDRHLVSPGFLEEVIPGQVLRDEQALGIGVER